MGGQTVRWVVLKDNTFTDNYSNPQGGNGEGGTIQFSACADRVEISGNDFTASGDFLRTDGMELYSRNLTITNNTVTGYPLEGITLNGVHDARVTGNTVTANGIPWTVGGILVSTAESAQPCEDPRDTQTVTIERNTSINQPFGVVLKDHDRHSSNTLNNVTVQNNVLTPNTYGQVAQDTIVVLDGYSGPTTTARELNAGPRALQPKAVSPVSRRCSSNGTQPETFTFSASDARGTDSIKSIEVFFSIDGADSDGAGGPDSGAEGCHFLYDRQNNHLLLDGPSGGSNFYPPSSVGAGGSALSNGYCTVHVGTALASSANFTLTLTLSIEFPTSNSSLKRKHIYTVTTDMDDAKSDSGAPKYWGWWGTS
jgi:parallel beta-helix repeat protein